MHLLHKIASVLTKQGRYQKLRRRIFLSLKQVVHLFHCPSRSGQVILFIIGCQRSGTTMLVDIFDRDIRSEVFREFSKLSAADPTMLRLPSFSTLESFLGSRRAQLIVSKPLFETQNALHLLDNFQDAKTLWMYRDYRDVSLSNIQKFGLANGIKDLNLTIDRDTANWRNEVISGSTREILQRYYSQDMNPYDACALFWYARNRLFFELGLHKHPRVSMCKYEELVEHPTGMINSIYNWMGIECPGDWCVTNVHRKSVSRGKKFHCLPK